MLIFIAVKQSILPFSDSAFRKVVTPKPPVSCLVPSLLPPQTALDRAFEGHVLSRYNVTSQLQCADYCLRHISCVAYSYKEGTTNHVMRDCELYDTVESVGMRRGFIAHKFDYSHAQKVPQFLCERTIT